MMSVLPPAFIPSGPSHSFLVRRDSQSLIATRVEPKRASEGVLPPAKGGQRAVHSVYRLHGGRRPGNSNASQIPRPVFLARSRLPRLSPADIKGRRFVAHSYAPLDCVAGTQQMPFGSRPSPQATPGDLRSKSSRSGLGPSASLPFSYRVDEAEMRLHLIPDGRPPPVGSFAVLGGIA